MPTLPTSVSPSSSAALTRRAVAAARAVPAVVVQAKGHGHAGTAMALAPVASVLFERVLVHDPADPQWIGRDRFVLSAGHASLLLYVQLVLAGYGLQRDELAASRAFGSRTPGHPERGVTPGVEMSTGPLGQGVAAAVGMALAARRERALFRPDDDLLERTVWALAGDGCLSEGVSGEASSLAGTLGLENLVLLWDDNRVTIDGPTSEAFGEDVRARYRAYGWRVLDLPDVHDLDAVEAVLREAARRTGRPTMVAMRTVIGEPSPAHAGLSSAHAGAFGAADVAAVLTALGFAPDAGLADLLPDDLLAATRAAAASRGAELHAAWQQRVDAWARDDRDGHGRWQRFRAGEGDLLERLAAVPAPDPATAVATRIAGRQVLGALHGTGADATALWGGSADLAGSTGVDVPGLPVRADRPAGDVLRFGVREHAMAAVANGIALDGPWRPFVSTYLVFSDYARPAIRLAALMGLPVVYVFTHDSLAVGEDGPTHQPVEQIAGLRTVPGLAVVRPADAGEVRAAWDRLLRRPEGPVALVLSRQALPVLPARDDLAEQVARGGYVVEMLGDGLDLALLATGSEVHLARAAARVLHEQDGLGVRVVSMPCLEWFAALPAAEQERVLPDGLRGRVAVEAGRTDGWYRWVGRHGAVVGVDEFGLSGAAATVLAARGVTVDAVVAAARGVVVRTGAETAD